MQLTVRRLLAALTTAFFLGGALAPSLASLLTLCCAPDRHACCEKGSPAPSERMQRPPCCATAEPGDLRVDAALAAREGPLVAVLAPACSTVLLPDPGFCTASKHPPAPPALPSALGPPLRLRI